MLGRGVAALAVAGALASAAHADPRRAALPPQPPGVPWPAREWPEAPPGATVDRARLDAAIDAIFARVGRSGVPDGRALVVVHRGAIVAERYAPGFDRGSRFESWSLAKSLTNALVGIAVREGHLSLDAPAPVPAWQGDGDPRRALTLNHLLHMTSGLANDDGGEDPDSFAARLLFGRENADTFALATAPPLAHTPDSRWAYSTSTSAILAGLVQRSVGGSKEAMLDFMRRELFDRLGMASAVPEFDAAGTFLGGSSVWISARDWARLGLLYLRDGVWDGGRVLPEGWVDYTRTPAPAPNNGTYGAHFWLNLPPKEGQFEVLPGGPASAFSGNGANGQYVTIVPTRDLVVVRLGEMQAQTWEELGSQIGALVAAFPPLAAGIE